MRLALRRSYDLLKPGGVFRLIVPDLTTRARQYLKAHDAGDPDAAGQFMEACCLGERHRPQGLERLVRLLGNSAHLWMGDEAGIRPSIWLRSMAVSMMRLVRQNWRCRRSNPIAPLISVSANTVGTGRRKGSDLFTFAGQDAHSPVTAMDTP